MREYIPRFIEKSYTVPANSEITDTFEPIFETSKVVVKADRGVKAYIDFCGIVYKGTFSVVEEFGVPCSEPFSVRLVNGRNSDKQATIKILGVIHQRR